MTDWHESFPTDLEKAKEVIKSKVPSSVITEQTGISKVSLSNYKTGRTDINRANWQTVHKLAEIWDNLRAQSEFNKPDFLPFLNQLHEYLDKTGNLDPGDPMYTIVQSISSMVTTDRMMLIILFKIYQETKS